MALNPIETLNVFNADLRDKLRKRALSGNLVKTRAPFLRFTTAADMSGLSKLGPQFDEYSGCKYFTLGLHGFENIDYARSDLYGTQLNKGLVIGTTYKDGQQKLVYTFGGGQTTIFQQGAVITTAQQSAKNYPPPGITTAKVERLRNGNVLKFTIETQCYTQEQLRVLDAVCFVPGMTAILEWGTQATTPKGQEKINVKLDFKDIGGVTNSIRSAMKLPRSQFIDSWCKPNEYNYDWAVAKIANVQTRLENNIYKVTITAYGVADNIMYISAYATVNPLDPTVAEREKAVISSINEYFKLNGKFSSFLKQVLATPTLIPESKSRYRNQIIKFMDEVDRKELAENLPASQDTGNTNDLGLEDAYFITFDFFVNLILNGELLSLINRGLSNETKLSALITPLTQNYTSPKAEDANTIFVGYNKFLRSTNPETMLIYNNRAREANQAPPSIKSAAIQQIGNDQSRTLGQLTERNENINRTVSGIIRLLKQQPFGQDVITEAGIAPLFQGVWLNSKAIQSVFLNARTIMEGLEALLRNVNAATENYWDLKLYYDDNMQQFRILDDNVRDVKFKNADKIYEFNKKLYSSEAGTIGPDVLDIQLNTDYPRMLYSQLAISGINGGYLANAPERRDIDFVGTTSVRDIFSNDPVVPPQQQSSTTPTRRSQVETETISSFVDNLFGQRGAIAFVSKTDFTNTLSAQFQQNQIPINVKNLLRDVFSVETLLTVPQANDFRNRLATLKTSGEITEAQSVTLTTLFANRAKGIIRQMKEKEKRSFKTAYDTWKQNPKGGNNQPIWTQTPVNAVDQKLNASRDAFIAVIDNAASTAKTQQQLATQQEAEKTAREVERLSRLGSRPGT
jgi:hypothetical protein